MQAKKDSLVDSIAVGAILVAALSRVTVSFAPIPVFDLDPALEAGPFVGAGPAESCLLDALSLTGSAWLLGTLAFSGRAQARSTAWSLALAAGAIIVCLFHAVADAEQLWRGVTWIASIVGAIALLGYLRSQDALGMRRACVGAICGIAVVMAMRGLSQMISEHPSMVAYYNQTKEHFLSANGWLPDSPQALAYERRLMQNEATGWIGFSNVFATISASTAVCLASLAIAPGRIAWRAVAAAAVALCAGLVIASGSKGGVAALAIGVAVCALMRHWQRFARIMMVSLPLMVILGIVLRGLAGSQLGEQSLLFRWHYLVGAAGSFLLSPWTGFGPAGFQSAFLLTRPGECVEEVLSAHNASADWLVAAGVAGLGWIALQVAMAWWSASRPSDECLDVPVDHCKPSTDGRSQVAQLAIAIIVLSAVISIGFEAPALDELSAYAWRIGGLLMGSAVAWVVVRLLECGGAPTGRAACAGLAGLAAAVVAHGQIDMVFWLPGSVMWAWIALATAAAWNSPVCSPGAQGKAPLARTTLITASIAGGLGALALAAITAPALSRQDEAAVRAAVNLNQQAQANSTTKLALARAQAGSALAEAAQTWPPRGWYEVRAAEQWQAAASADPPEADSSEWLRNAGVAARSASGLHSVRFPALLVGSTVALRAAARGEVQPEEAIEAIERVLALNSRHVESWIRLADAYTLAGRPDSARQALINALEADESYRLDPLRRLPLEARAQVEERIARLQGAPGQH